MTAYPPPLMPAWRSFVAEQLRAAREYLALPKEGRGPRWKSRGGWPTPEPDEDDSLTND
jgi:hypothetical protein